VDAGCGGNTSRHATPESGAGDEAIVSIAGRVSCALLSRCRHARIEAERRAPDEIAAR
jgi:hypothetical protein